MGGQTNRDPVIYIRPLRMVVGALRQQGDAAHETKSLYEITEFETTTNAAAILVKLPARQFRQCGHAFLASQFCNVGHDDLLQLTTTVHPHGGAGQAMTQAALSLQKLACLRGGRLLFTNLNLDLEPGDSAQIAGPNGIGKSSLLRIVAGLLRPFAGTVQRTGTVALTDELDALDRERTVHAALTFWGRMDDAPPMRIDAALEALGIAHLAGIPVRMLSTGQRKRAALARTLASDASIWLLDEPANGLDVQAAATLGDVVAHHRARGGIVLAASHLPLAWAQDVTLHLTAPRDDMPDQQDAPMPHLAEKRGANAAKPVRTGKDSETPA